MAWMIVNSWTRLAPKLKHISCDYFIQINKWLHQLMVLNTHNTLLNRIIGCVCTINFAITFINAWN